MRNKIMFYFPLVIGILAMASMFYFMLNSSLIMIEYEQNVLSIMNRSFSDTNKLILNKTNPQTNLDYTCPDCICNYEECKECPELKCDTSALQRERLQSARAIAEVEYYKNLTFTVLSNRTFEDVQANLTECIKDKQELEVQIGEIYNLTQGGD